LTTEKEKRGTFSGEVGGKHYLGEKEFSGKDSVIGGPLTGAVRDATLEEQKGADTFAVRQEVSD